MLKIWRPADLDSLELRVGTSFQHDYPLHWHDEFFVSAITAGAGSFRYRGSDHLATPGTLVLVVPGEVHTHHDCGGGRSFRSLQVPAPFLAAAAAEVLRRPDSFPDFPSSMIADPRLLRLFLGLHRLFEGRGTLLHRESRLLGFFAELLRRVGKDGLGTPADGRECLAVRRARDYLNDHYARRVSLGDLATVAGLSPFHFHRVFCRQTGMPPHAYQIQLRIMRARTLLRKRLPIADVASVTGFADQSHLNRHFKRLEGVTPSGFVARSKNVQDMVSRPR
jgi:AraC-like DNA-binding protein